MGHQNNISFDGLTPEAAKNLADGFAASSSKRINDIFGRMKEIKDMDEVTFKRMQDLAAAGNGGCFIGCSGAAS
ncbi:hypothetical protein [Hoeflea olei]|uniref:Uncharacterized protein n=1 Tax=Hoeflea olei TaxID=1480615 RepID=A0A1C1YXE4_9HYPH|nr:hypothetical protein [Hoeflea olei]OCW58224.1 hypothetical protein AWJ14_01310 [Hoeflea olei]